MKELKFKVFKSQDHMCYPHHLEPIKLPTNFILSNFHLLLTFIFHIDFFIFLVPLRLTNSRKI